jgi:putative transposase
LAQERRRSNGRSAKLVGVAQPIARCGERGGVCRRSEVADVVDDVTKECLAANPDTSISGRRVARELDAIIARRGKPELIVSDTEFTVLHRLARRDEVPGDLCGLHPGEHGVGGCGATLSSMASASRRLSLAFSSSSDFSRFASETSMPPNFAFQA